MSREHYTDPYKINPYNQPFVPGQHKQPDQNQNRSSQNEGRWSYRDWLAKVFIPILAAFIGAGVIFGPKLTSSPPSNPPSFTPTPAPPSIPQLHASYTGSVIAVDGSQGVMNLSIDSEDQQGNLNAGVSYNVSGGQFSCTGKVGSNDVIHLSCTNVIDVHVIALNGTAQSDGSIVGTDSLGGNWQVF
jgi:hypothetical protein